MVQLLSASLGLEIDAEESDIRIPVELSKLEQVVFNLVDNACKYGKGAKNQIDVKVRLRNGKLVVSVRDYGTGVPKHVRKKLFQPFCKSDQEAANTAQGVGLGLAATTADMQLGGASATAFQQVGVLGGLGAGIGAVLASGVGPTELPQTVAAFHSLVGLAAMAGAAAIAGHFVDIRDWD